MDPEQSTSAAVGQPNSIEKAKLYLDRIVGNWASDEMKLAFLGAGPAMIEYFDRHTDVKLVARTYSPDYYPDVEGASSRWPVDGSGPVRRAGARGSLRLLRSPLKEFVVLGGMMVNMTDVYHLLNVTKSFASWRHGMKLVMRYALDRLRYPRGTRLLLGNALAGRLFKSVLDRKIPVWVSTPAQRLVVEDGRVAGMVVRKDGRELCDPRAPRRRARDGRLPKRPETEAKSSCRSRPASGRWRPKAIPATACGSGKRSARKRGVTMPPMCSSRRFPS